MSKTTICNNLEWQFHSNFDFSGETPVLVDGSSWNKFQSRSKISLATDSENTDSGTVIKEIVTCSGLSKNCDSLKTPAKRIVLQVDINGSKKMIGSEHYPAIKTFSDNGTITTLTFTRQSSL